MRMAREKGGLAGGNREKVCRGLVATFLCGIEWKRRKEGLGGQVA